MAEEVLENNSAEVLEIEQPSDIIDATQSVIIDAAENVKNAFETESAVVEEQIHEVPIYMDTEFWVGMAFIFAVLVLLRPGLRFMKKFMEGRIASVISQIENAQNLRDEAQKLLADYERKFRNTDKETAEILSVAQANIERQKKEELEKLQNYVAMREKEAKRRIAHVTQKAQAEINDSVSSKAVNLAKLCIENFAKKSKKSKLIDAAIADLDKFL